MADFPAVARQVESGLGVGLFPDHPVHLRRLVRAGRVTARRLGVDDRVELCLYTHADTPLPAELEALCDAIRTVVADAERDAVIRPSDAPDPGIDRTGWAGTWWLAVGRAAGDPDQAEVRTGGEDRVEVRSAASGDLLYSGLMTATAVVLARAVGAGALAITLVRTARHRRTGAVYHVGHATVPSPGGPVVRPAVLSPSQLSPSDWYWLTERLDG